MKQDHWRQLDIVSLERLQKTQVTIIGAGGIGSPAALALAKMGVGALDIWDSDLVEVHNLPNQFHRLADIGKSKVLALQGLIQEFVDDDTKITVHQEHVEADTRLDGIVISAVDSMKSRSAIWDAAKKSMASEAFIDARMGAQLFRLYKANPHDPLSREEYEKTLYTDEEAEEMPCTAQSIIYTGLLAGALIAHTVKLYVGNEPILFEIIYDIPSSTIITR